MRDLPFTIGDALQIPALAGVRVLAGSSGLGRPLAGVSVLERPDPEALPPGAELVLTSGYPLRDDPQSLTALVESLAARGAAGLGLQFSQWLPVLPAAVRALADELALPIIEFPAERPWVEVVGPVMQQVFAAHGRSVHQRLAEAALTGGGVDGLVARLAALLGQATAVVSRRGELLAFSSGQQGPARPDVLAWLQDGGLEGCSGEGGLPAAVQRLSASRGMPAALLAPLQVSGEPAVALVVFAAAGPPGHLDLLTIEHGATLLSLEITGQRSLQAAERRHRDEFLMDLLFGRYGSSDELVGRGLVYGLDPRRYSVVLAVDFGDMGAAAAADVARERAAATAAWILRTYPGCTWVAVGETIVILLEAARDDADPHGPVHLAELLRREIGRVVPQARVAVGIGARVQRPAQVSDSFHQARQALELGRQLWGPAGVFHHDDLGVYRLLISGVEPEELQRFQAAALGPVLDNETLLATLEAYLDHDHSATAAARALHVHPNTVKYRLQRLRYLLAVDLHKNAVRLQLMAALKIRRLLAEQREQAANAGWW